VLIKPILKASLKRWVAHPEVSNPHLHSHNHSHNNLQLPKYVIAPLVELRFLKVNPSVASVEIKCKYNHFLIITIMALKPDKDFFIDVLDYLKSEDGVFDSEYMVLFDGEKEEGPYNDAYLFCYVKHGLITKDTLVREVCKSKRERAYENSDLKLFFDYIEHTPDDKNDVTEESDLGDNIPKSLLKLYFDNEDLFEEVDGVDKVLEYIHEYNYNGETFFSKDDLEGYLKEDLSESQNAIVEKMVKETYRFLLHTKWDADLPAELIDMSVDVAELFDEYDHIDHIILRNTYNSLENKDLNDVLSVDDYLDFLLGKVIHGIEPNNEQKKVLEKIAQLQYNLENS
jgi:hypothetical protein